MEKHLFTVYDSAAKAYLNPFVAPSIEFAIREFRTVVNKEGHQFNKYPEDYTLFHCGSFSVALGTLNPEGPTSLGVAITFKEPSQQLSLMEDHNNG